MVGSEKVRDEGKHRGWGGVGRVEWGEMRNDIEKTNERGGLRERVMGEI